MTWAQVSPTDAYREVRLLSICCETFQKEILSFGGFPRRVLDFVRIETT